MANLEHHVVEVVVIGVAEVLASDNPRVLLWFFTYFWNVVIINISLDKEENIIHVVISTFILYTHYNLTTPFVSNKVFGGIFNHV